jgi:polyisoprenoid-binding protein YceI
VLRRRHRSRDPGDAVVSAGTLRIPAARLDCRNNTMNDHMRKALKADAHPTITFILGTYDLVTVEERMKAEFTGTLALGGTTRDVTINADIVSESPGVLRVTGSYDLRMTEFGLKPPSLMLGTMKVHDLVKVRFDLMLKN